MTDTATIDDHAIALAPDTIRIERLLPGPIERVWSHLTQSELRRRWLAAGDMDLHPGASFTLTWRNDELTAPPGVRPEGMSDEHSATCTILAIKAPTLLRYEWPDVGEVTFELQSSGSDVMLTLTHARAPSASVVLGVSAGWHGHLDLLDAVLRDQQPEPFWDRWRTLRATYQGRLSE